MDVVILAGGHGVRMWPETRECPKPLLDIGGRPILSHIMDYYRGYGHERFIVCTGYLGGMIRVKYAGNSDVQCLYTGKHTETGGRLLEAIASVQGDEFMFTYGDGLSNVDLDAVLAHHRETKALVTVTAVHPPSRFGEIDLDAGIVTHFSEKPQTSRGWINGGFMIMKREVAGYLWRGNHCILEGAPLQALAKEKRLAAYEYNGFWLCADTIRELTQMRSLWDGGEAPWAR